MIHERRYGLLFPLGVLVCDRERGFHGIVNSGAGLVEEGLRGVE